MSRRATRREPVGETMDVDDVLDELADLESDLTAAEDQRRIRRTMWMLEHVPGRTRIQKYTTRDMGEAFVGGLIFAMPLLVEDGVFDIADWFVEHTVGGVPVFLVANVCFVIAITTGLLYAVDIREVTVSRPLFGVVPRRLVGILVISFGCAAGMMLFWGRLHVGEPTSVEAFGRTTVVWASAALGAVLADILPGESKGRDIADLIDD